MKKRKRLLSLIALTALVFTLLAGCQTKTENQNTSSGGEPSATTEPSATDAAATPVPTKDDAQSNLQYPKTVSIGYFTGNDDNVLVKENGWLEEALSPYGVEVKWVNFQAGREMNNAMLAKSIDFSGGIGDPPVAIAAASNIPYEVFWISSVIGESEALVAKNSSNITSIADLKGKKIATTVSSTSHYSLLSALELNGLSPTDVNIIDLTPPDIVAAWERGDIDAAYTWDPNLSKLYADGTKLISSKDLAAQGAPTSGYDIVRTEFAQKYPQVVKAYIDALIKAHALYTNDPDTAGELWAKANSITKEDALLQAKGTVWLTAEQQLTADYLGTSAQKGKTVDSIKKIGDFLVDQKSLDSKLDASAYDKYVNPSYLENAIK